MLSMGYAPPGTPGVEKTESLNDASKACAQFACFPAVPPSSHIPSAGPDSDWTGEREGEPSTITGEKQGTGCKAASCATPLYLPRGDRVHHCPKLPAPRLRALRARATEKCHPSSI